MIIMTMTNFASAREFIWAAHGQTVHAVFPKRTSSTLIREPHCRSVNTKTRKTGRQTLLFGSSSKSKVI